MAEAEERLARLRQHVQRCAGSNARAIRVATMDMKARASAGGGGPALYVDGSHAAEQVKRVLERAGVLAPAGGVALRAAMEFKATGKGGDTATQPKAVLRLCVREAAPALLGDRPRIAAQVATWVDLSWQLAAAGTDGAQDAIESLEAQMSGNTYVAGGSAVSIADFALHDALVQALGPSVDKVRNAFRNCDNLSRWFDHIQAL